MIGKAVSYQVITWDIAGDRTSVACSDLAEAKKMAKQRRTIDNRAVKIADAFGTRYHWLRVLGSKTNRWVAQDVANDIFMQE